MGEENTRTLAELAASQARLEGIVASVKDAIITVNAAQRITLFNAAAERMFGYTAEMMLGEQLEKLIPQRFHAAHPAHMQRFGETGVSQRTMGGHGTQWGRRANGQEFPIEASISQVEINGEKLFTAIVRDATERLRAEQELADSRLQLAGIVASAMDAIITVDDEQRITLFNNAAEKMFGYRGEIMLGQPLDMLIPERYRVMHPEHINRFGNTGTTTRSMGGLSELTALKANGQEFPIEASISQIAIAGRKFFTVILRDLTVRQKAEDALRTSQQQYKRIVETTHEGIWLIDTQFVTTFVNPRMAEILGYKVEEMTGRPLSDFMSEEAYTTAQESIHEQMTQGLTHQLDITFLRKDGSNAYCIISANAVLDDSGAFIGSMAMCTDISDRKLAETERAKLEEQFLQAQKMEAIGTLAGGIAHDFNNILAAIRGYGELVLENLEVGSQDYQDQQEVLQASERASQLVRQILTFSRKTESKSVLVSLPLLVKEVVKLMHATLPSTIEVRQNIAESEALVTADPIEIHQILVNLCTNAGYAMQDSGGVLEVGLRHHSVHNGGSYGAELDPGEYHLLSVADTGMGIPPEIVERIFEPFFTTKEAGEGTGLGLSTVHGVVTKLGGKVTVYSEAGLGTTFHVYLPASEGTQPDMQAQAPVHGTGRILLVDDEAPLARLGKHILEDLGYIVHAETSSITALSIFQSSPNEFDLVITDETMPKLKGTELAKFIADIRPDLPILLCTGYGQDIQSTVSSIKRVLHKPVSRSELSQAIGEVLADSKLIG